MSRLMKACLAFSISMMLVASGMFVLTQLIKTEVSSGGGTGPTGNETLPDLSITPADIWFSDNSPDEGDMIHIFASIHNIGGSPAYNFTVEFWDDTCEGCPAVYLIGEDSIPELQPGHLSNVTVPWDTTGQPGDNVITVIADPLNLVLESDEDNNEASKSIYVKPTSDNTPPEIFGVMVDGLQEVKVPAGSIVELTAIADDTVTGMSNIRNANYTIGKANWPRSTPMDALDGDFDSPLEIVQAYINTSGWTDGFYEMWVYACDWVGNCNIIGDFATIEISGNMSGPDLSIAPEDFYVSDRFPRLGETVYLWAYVRNIGNEDAFNVTIQFTDLFGINMTIIDEAFVDHFPAGDVKNFSAVWIAGPAGLHLLDVMADPDDTIPEIKEDNNAAMELVIVEDDPRRPDLEPCGFYFSDSTPDEGQVVSIRLMVFNRGNEDAYNVTVEFTDLVGGMPPGFLIGRATIPLIKVGYLGNATVDWTATPAGFHTIRAVIDPDDVIPELDENNNVAEQDIYVGGTGIDLTLSPSDIFFDDDTPEEGQPVIIWAYIHNIGTEDAYNVTVQFIDWFEGGSIPLPDAIIDHIPAGSYGNATTIWLAVPSGNHTIQVIADPYNLIPESDESNNDAVRRVTVGPVGGYRIFVKATMFDNDNDGRYDDVVILVYDSDNHAVEGASIYVNGIYYGLTADTGLLVLLNFSLGTHQVMAVYGSLTATTSFHSEG
jgi:hypothetical protein